MDDLNWPKEVIALTGLKLDSDNWRILSSSIFLLGSILKRRALMQLSSGTLTLGFPYAITFYSISEKFDQILLEIAFNTNIKYILNVIIKKLAFWKMHSYGYMCSKF